MNQVKMPSHSNSRDIESKPLGPYRDAMVNQTERGHGQSWQPRDEDVPSSTDADF